MCAFLACLFYAIFWLNVVGAALDFLMRIKLIQFGLDLDFVFGKKIAERLNASVKSTAIVMAVSYLLYIIFWYYA